jgi:hypothetical protein
MSNGCNAIDDIAPGVGFAASGFGIEPDPDKYGLLDLAVIASIRFLAAAILSATDWFSCGVGGRDAGPAGLAGAVDEDAEGATAAGAGAPVDDGAGAEDEDPDSREAASRASTAALLAASLARISAMFIEGAGPSVRGLLLSG